MHSGDLHGFKASSDVILLYHTDFMYHLVPVAAFGGSGLHGSFIQRIAAAGVRTSETAGGTCLDEKPKSASRLWRLQTGAASSFCTDAQSRFRREIDNPHLRRDNPRAGRRPGAAADPDVRPQYGKRRWPIRAGTHGSPSPPSPSCHGRRARSWSSSRCCWLPARWSRPLGHDDWSIRSAGPCLG